MNNINRNKDNLKSVDPKKSDIAIKDVIADIEKGDELQKSEVIKSTEDIKIKYIDSIILKPDYQREYRFSMAEESSLIESILVGIPIPPVFLCTTRYKGVRVIDVVDGQHRLKAFYRFWTNAFPLSDLPILSHLNGKTYSDLDIEYKEKILSYKLSTYVFENFPGKNFELEVFNRYNRGSKPLTAQEIRNAVYASPYNDWVSDFVEKLYKSDNNPLKEIYNVTKSRFLKKKVHEGIFTILYVLEHGICTNFKNSTDYANEYMQEKSLFSKNNIENKCENETEDDLDKMISRFNKFNDWLVQWKNITAYPLSKEIYGVSSKSYKFQTSMALIVPALYKKIYIDKEVSFNNFSEMKEAIQNLLNKSFLESSEYTASSTNSREIKKLIESFTS